MPRIIWMHGTCHPRYCSWLSKELDGGGVYGLEVPPLQDQGQELVPDGKEEEEDDGEDHLHVGPRDEAEHTEDQQLHQLE